MGTVLSPKGKGSGLLYSFANHAFFFHDGRRKRMGAWVNLI